MLVLLFGEADDAAAAHSVPTNRYELYMLVLSKVVTRRLSASNSELSELHPAAAMDMLRTVAVANYGTLGNPNPNSNPNSNPNPNPLALALTSGQGEARVHV